MNDKKDSVLIHHVMEPPKGPTLPHLLQECWRRGDQVYLNASQKRRTIQATVKHKGGGISWYRYGVTDQSIEYMGFVSTIPLKPSPIPS